MQVSSSDPYFRGTDSGNPHALTPSIQLKVDNGATSNSYTGNTAQTVSSSPATLASVGYAGQYRLEQFFFIYFCGTPIKVKTLR